MRNFRNFLIYSAVFAFGFIATYESLKIGRIFVKKSPAATPTPNIFTLATPRPIDQIQPEKQDSGTYNILFLGYGGTGHSGGLLTDSIITAHVNTNSKSVTFISIPRDLWLTGNRKINEVGISGFSNIAPAVTSVIGLPINYFVAVDFTGFSKIIDTLGGISVNTPASFDDPYYPIKGEENNTCGYTNEEIENLKSKYSGYQLEIQFTCRYERVRYEKGPAELNGTNALKYVRSRHGDSDFGRSARQFAVLEGIAKKLTSLKAAGKFDEIVDIVSTSVKTDLDAGTIKWLLQILGNPADYKYNTIQLTTDNVLASSKGPAGQFILVPKAGSLNFSEIKSFVNTAIKRYF